MKIFGLLFSLTLFILPATAQQQLQSFFSKFQNQKQNGFLKNGGQVRDVNNEKVNFVYYQANMGEQQVFVTNYGLSILVSRIKKITWIGDIQLSKISRKNLSPSDSSAIVDYEMERVDIVLKNAVILQSHIIARSKPGSPTFNIYADESPSAGQDLELKDELIVKDVYPGIDWKLYIKEDEDKKASLKYDFVVHPGADPTLIELRYSDNAKIKLSGNEINATFNMGLIKEADPFSYLQESKSKVDVKFKTKNNNIKFITGNYDLSKTLIIDPSIFWLTYLSSTNLVWAVASMLGNDIETDAAGNIFVQLSAAANIPFPTVNPGGGAYFQNYTSAPNGSMIIAKFAPGGQMLWSTYFGNGVGGRLMTIDKFGNIVAIGRKLATTPSVPVINYVIPMLDNGGYFDNSSKSYFISKFSNSGVLLWSTAYADFSSYPTDMTYDVNGNIYVVGWSTVWDFPVVDPGGGAYVVNNAQFGWAQVLFISQFNSNCNLTWSTRIEGNDYDPYARVCTDVLGNIYLGGQNRSTNYPLVNAGGYFSTTNYSNVITRFNSARQMTWSTYFTGAFSLADITTDDSCNLYVVSGQSITKFNSSTQFVYEKRVNTNRMYFWQKINYDPVHDNFQLLGVMNDAYWGFPTLNTGCNGSFFNNGISPHVYTNATGPIFATIGHNGEFSYLSLADWVYEYYEYNEMAIDINGDPIYLFFDQQNGYTAPNPQLTNPGNGAYFDPNCCFISNGNKSALLLKLTSSELLVTTQFTSPAGCNCDGQAEAAVLCGQAPFTYLWSNGANTAIATGLCPGNYWVKVTDVDNLSSTTYFSIPYPPGSITSFSTSVIPENCNKSNAVIAVQNVVGGITPYTYSIDGTAYTAIPQFIGLDSGNYIVRVKDANGCVFNDTIFIARVAGPTTANYGIQNSSCIANDGRLQVSNVSGGVGPYQYSLSGHGSNSMGIFINLSAGNYQLLVSDSAGCFFTKDIVIPQSLAPTSINYSLGADHCSQGIGYLQISSVTGGTAPYTFSIDSILFSAATINNLPAGNYPLYVRDSNGCVLTKGPVVVNNEPGPGELNYSVDHAYCGKLNGNVKVNSVLGGFSPFQYSLDGGLYVSSVNFTSIQPGNHTLSVKDAFGCIQSNSFIVQFEPIADVKLFPGDTTICYDETINLFLRGDINRINNIVWNIPAQGSSTSIKATDEKRIIVTITDGNNCIVKDTSIISVKACSPPERCIVIPTAFTPNNDGKNETLGPLTNGCRIQKINFTIYNRWGQMIFETNDLNKKWNGVYNGIPQSSGVFVFYCNYITEDNVSRSQKGTFMLLR